MKARLALLLVALASFPALAAPPEKHRLAYATEATGEVASDWSLSITIAGSDQLAGFVRSLHPILSLNRVHVRAQGRLAVALGKAKLENDEARTEGAYDDDPFLFDFKRSEPPAAPQKLEALMLALSAGRGFQLSPRGEYRSDDPNQDHNGEAMDHYLLGITRLPEKPVEAGESYVVEWTGERSEKGKQGRYAFRQTTKVESIEARGDARLVTLVSVLVGELRAPDSEKNPAAVEQWTRCEGTTRLVLEEPSGRVVSSSGQGTVTGYFRGQAEDGSKNEVKLTFAVAGRTEVAAPRGRLKGRWF
jgi:hypothetical protein